MFVPGKHFKPGVTFAESNLPEGLSGVPLYIAGSPGLVMEKVSRHKRSSLLGPFVSYKEKMFCENGPCFLSVKTLFLVIFYFEE